MFRCLLRTAGRAVKTVNVAATGAAFAAGRKNAASLATIFEPGRPAVSAAVFAALTITVGGSVAYAASNQERSFIMVKPDGVNRALVGEIIKRFEQKGYKLVGIKVVVPSADLAKLHYAEHEGKPFFPKLVDFLSSGPVVGMCWEGKDVVTFGRTMIGATNPLASSPGTIRGDFGVDVGRNIIHGSDSVESAQREIALWFSPDDLADYEVSNKGWVYE